MAPKIFETFGYPVTDTSAEANANRKAARCPFMDADCDGGGNRHLSSINLSAHPQLRSFFGNRTTVQSGVCSIQVRDNESPWIVCPRRLLALARVSPGTSSHQEDVSDSLLRVLPYPSGTALGVWGEVKIIERNADSRFDYTFDYVVLPIGTQTSEELEARAETPWPQLRRAYENAGYTIVRRGGTSYVDDAPIGPPTIIEIMTSSTSGGNKKKRTNIPAAFEDAILGRDHVAPGINYRQVWGRMVSQLIAKSEVGLAWDGLTVWIVQDNLVNYINQSTGLNLANFLSQHTSEVNMLSFGYDGDYQIRPGVIELRNENLYAGPISGYTATDSNAAAGFQDIIRAPRIPPVSLLHSVLARKQRLGVLNRP